MLFGGSDPGLGLLAVLGASEAGLMSDLVAEYLTVTLLKATDLASEASCARVSGREGQP